MSDAWVKPAIEGFFKGIAFLCIVAPLAYCTAQDKIATEATKRACIEARGQWAGWFGGTCEVGNGRYYIHPRKISRIHPA